MTLVVAFAGLLLFAYGAAAASRRRKQKIVEREWLAAMPGQIRWALGAISAPPVELDEAGSRRVSEALVAGLYDGFRCGNFSDLMRAMTVASPDAQEAAMEHALDAAIAALPASPTGAHSVRTAMRVGVERAGSAASAAGERSGEV